jgi:hypothetical protein
VSAQDRSAVQASAPAPITPLSVSTRFVPEAVAPGQRVAIQVDVRDERGAPVSGASVRLSAGGGRFLSSQSEAFDPRSRLHSPYDSQVVTDGTGRATGYWVCNPCADGYQFEVAASAPGHTDSHTTAQLRILQPLTLSANVAPQRVGRGERAAIRVLVVDRNGAPVEGALVKVGAGGGSFFAAGGDRLAANITAQGPFEWSATSDAQGFCSFWWACSPCASGYQFEVSASKAGYALSSTTASVQIR